MPMARTEGSKKRRDQQTERYLPGGGRRFCVGRLVDAMMVVFAGWLAIVERLDEKTMSKDQ
jgi:hypothetical protein